MSRPKILFFVATLVVGGAEMHTLRLARALEKADFPVEILVHGSSGAKSLSSWPQARDARRLGLRGMSDLKGWITVWRTLRRLQPDIIVCVNQTPFIISEIARRTFATRAKLACIFHTTVMQPFEAHLETPFRILGRNLDLLVYVGEGQRRVWTERGLRARREIVIQNGVDLEQFNFDPGARAAVRAQLGFSTDAFILAMVAAFRDEKRHEDLIRSLALAQERGSRAKLILVGDGPKYAAVQELARTLGLMDAIRFLGETGDVRPFLAASDIGVITSSIETFPLTALEFLATGRPLLTSEVVGALEIVPIRNRLTHSVGDVERLAENILAAERRERYADLAEGAREAVKQFAEDKMAAAYAEAFQNLHDGKC